MTDEITDLAAGSPPNEEPFTALSIQSDASILLSEFFRTESWDAALALVNVCAEPLERREWKLPGFPPSEKDSVPNVLRKEVIILLLRFGAFRSRDCLAEKLAAAERETKTPAVKSLPSARKQSFVRNRTLPTSRLSVEAQRVHSRQRLWYSQEWSTLERTRSVVVNPALAPGIPIDSRQPADTELSIPYSSQSDMRHLPRDSRRQSENEHAIASVQARLEQLYVEVLYTITNKVGASTGQYAHYKEDLYLYAQEAFGISSDMHRKFMAIASEEKVSQRLSLSSAVAGRLACSTSHQGESGSIPGFFSKWESCRAMPLVCGLSRASPFSNEHPILLHASPLLVPVLLPPSALRCLIDSEWIFSRLLAPNSRNVPLDLMKELTVYSHPLLHRFAPCTESFGERPLQPPLLGRVQRCCRDAITTKKILLTQHRTTNGHRLLFTINQGPAMAERLARSHPLPSKANRVQYPAESLPDFRKWESCRIMPLVGGFRRRSPVSPSLHSCAAPY
ncbi:hypothetical protein PR048_000325 [Dryococelus australis]|uniref:LisH domain-containing protein n=1 Tax=Dryococelus australis TaxID=614101 RepID=A0ABQ9IED1_9NEOP|nr:hypothetical protein PR048_000325 [Dryococelus australis]